MPKKIMFYCHYSLGIGHLHRILALARKIKEKNSKYEVLLVFGGRSFQELKIPKGLKIIHLPAVKEIGKEPWLTPINKDYSLEQIKQIRKEKLLFILSKFRPDVLIVEHFPFGRHALAFEITPMLDYCTYNLDTKIICSVRDIVVPQHKEQELYLAKTKQYIKMYFDYILIHSNPYLFRLEEEFKFLKKIEDKIIYTGYVASKQKNELIKKEKIREQLGIVDEKLVVVNVGGGDVGFEILENAIFAKKELDKEFKTKFLVSTGPFISEKRYQRLLKLRENDNDILITKYNPQLVDYINAADLNISMGGYNACMNAFVTKVPIIVVPYMENEEQRRRAKTFREFCGLQIIFPDELTPEKIALKIKNIFNRKTEETFKKQKNPVASNIDILGVEKTSSFVDSLLYRKINVFFRNDDVFGLTTHLRNFTDLFLSEKIPVCYQIIPKDFSDACAKWLKKSKKKILIYYLLVNMDIPIKITRKQGSQNLEITGHMDNSWKILGGARIFLIKN